MATAIDAAGVLLKTIIAGNYTNTLADGTVVTDAVNRSYADTYLNGTGGNKAQVIYHDTRSLLTATNETINLRSLVTAFGTGVISKLKSITINVNTTSSGYTLKMKPGTSSGFAAWLTAGTDEVIIGAGGELTLSWPVDGLTVDATHCNLLITNPSGGTVSYDIVVIGEGTD